MLKLTITVFEPKPLKPQIELTATSMGDLASYGHDSLGFMGG